MKTFLPLALLATAAYALWWYFVGSKRDKLDEHLDEQKNLQRIGTTATRASVNAAAQTPLTRVEPGPLNGAVLTPISGGGGAPRDIPDWAFPQETPPEAWLLPVVMPGGAFVAPVWVN